MSFLEIIKQFESFDVEYFQSGCSQEKVKQVLSKSFLSEEDFCVLLSDAAAELLEQIAQKALTLTRRHFGNAIFVFTPLYISNYCDNFCPYCSFAKQHTIIRKHLSLDEIDKVADLIVKKNIRHLLILTGESRSIAPPEYIYSALERLNKKFSSLSMEIYALTEDEYRSAVKAGMDGLTLYQETYDRVLYEKLHGGGPKADYEFRLEAPDRGARAGVRAVTVGALFGLTDWRKETFLTGLHASYLQKKYPSLEVSVSFPRICPLTGEFSSDHTVTDRQFVQMMTAMRLFLPSVGITLSTRESKDFRNSVLPLGITKMSAGVSTAVGGNDTDSSTAQFEIADERSVEEVKNDLLEFGFQPVMHDWNRAYLQ